MSLQHGPAVNQRGPSLTILPPETLTMICQSFYSHIGETQTLRVPEALLQNAIRADGELSQQLVDQGSLHALCLTSKYLRGIAQPVLYHTFAPGCGETSLAASRLWDQRLPLFMRTIWGRRDLAALVRRLVIHPNLLQRVTCIEAIATAYDVLVQMELPFTGDPALVSWISRTWPSWPNALIYDRSGGLKPDLVQMLVHLLPNLSHLSLHISSDMAFRNLPRSVLSTLANRKEKAQLPLKVLDVRLYSPKSSLFTLGHTARSIPALSSQLETLNIDMAGQHAFHPLPAMPSLKNIRITHSWFHETQMRKLLLAAQGGLETFMYETGHEPLGCARACCSNLTTPLWQHFSPASIVEFLQPHQSTLTMMHLDLRRRGGSDRVLGDEQDDPRPMPTLRDFGALTRLVLDVDSVYDNYETYEAGSTILTSFLPSNVAFFGLTGFPKTAHIAPVLSSLDGLADAVLHGQFGGLREVRCDIELEPGSGGLLGRFAEAGVRLSFCDWPLSQPAMPGGWVIDHREIYPPFWAVEDYT